MLEMSPVHIAYWHVVWEVKNNRASETPEAVFYGHLKQKDLGSLPVSIEKSVFYGQPKQED